MTSIVRKVKRALVRAFDTAEVQNDIAQLTQISKLLLAIEQADAADAAANPDLPQDDDNLAAFMTTDEISTIIAIENVARARKESGCAPCGNAARRDLPTIDVTLIQRVIVHTPEDIETASKLLPDLTGGARP